MKILLWAHPEFLIENDDFLGWLDEFRTKLVDLGNDVTNFLPQEHKIQDFDLIHIFSNVDKENWPQIRKIGTRVVVTPSLNVKPDENIGFFRNFVRKTIRVSRAISQKRWPPVDEAYFTRAANLVLLPSKSWYQVLKQNWFLTEKRFRVISDSPIQAAAIADQSYKECRNRIAFNARVLGSDRLRGWSRYAINLLVELADLDLDIFLYSDQPLADYFLKRLNNKRVTIRIAPKMNYFLWEQFWLPKQCSEDNIDIFHSLTNFGLPWMSPCPRVLTLHDAIDKVYFLERTPIFSRIRPSVLKGSFLHWLARTAADKILTVSQHSKNDFIKYLNIASNKVSVSYEAADPHFRKDISKEEQERVFERYQITKPYIFYVGGWEGRKNVSFLLDAFTEASLGDVQLVLVGGTKELKDKISKKYSHLRDSLKLLEWVRDQDVSALYNAALCFVYPSEYEGFGLQLCEAMMVGCPILAARSSCLPEILGDGGVTFDLSTVNELVNLLEKVANNNQYRDQLRVASKRRSQFFSWSKTAASTNNVYEELLINKL